MLEQIGKAAAVYAVLILYMRLMGKRQLGDLEPSELIVTVLLSEVAGAPITDPEASLWNGLVPLTTLFALEYLLSHVTVRSVKLRKLLSGKPSLLVRRGQIDQSQMRRNRFTPDELAQALRNHGILNLQNVDFAVLETDGQLNIILKPGAEAVTAEQMNVPVSDGGYPLIVINNGRVLSKNLAVLGRDETWLQRELRRQSIASPADVYMMTCDMDGRVWLAPMDKSRQ